MEFEKIFHKHRRLTQIDWDILIEEAYGSYVEVGTLHGASAVAAAKSADRVVTIDVYDWEPKLFTEDSNITFFKGTSADYAKSVEGREPFIDVLFIDGCHEFEYVRMDCERMYPLVKKGGTVMFHDHNPNNPANGVHRAVEGFLEKVHYERYPKVEGSSNLLKVKKL